MNGHVPPIVRKALKALLRPFFWSLFNAPFLRNYGTLLLSKWEAPEQRNSFENLVLPYAFHYWSEQVYIKEPSPEKREAMKSICMGGNSGASWAEHYDSQEIDFSRKVGNLTFEQSNPAFRRIERMCENAPEGLVILQAGSSSGRELGYFARKFEKISFIGFDIDAAIIDRANGVHASNNLDFVVGRAEQIDQIIASLDRRPIIVFASSSLQYVQPEYIDRFFRSLAGHNHTSIVICEPGQDYWGPPNEIGGSRWSGNFCFTHDYKFFALQAGFSIRECRIISPYEGIRERAHTIHYFLVCDNIDEISARQGSMKPES